MSWVVHEEYPPGGPPELGAACYFCKASKRRDLDEKVLDPNIHISFEGFIYVCSTCIEEAASLVGMRTAAQVNNLAEKVQKLESELVEAWERAKNAETALKAVEMWKETKGVRSPAIRPTQYAHSS